MKIKKRNILIILLFLVAIVLLGSVSATNNVDTAINSNLNNCDDSVMNYTGFQEMIDKDTTGVVNNNVANTTINDDVGVANYECDESVLNVLPVDTVINNNSYVSMGENSNLNVEVSGANADDSFTALNKTITDSNGTIILQHDYIMYANEVSTYKEGISINKNIAIIGNGYSINANKTGRIFTLGTDVVLTLKNITLKNGNTTDNGGAIYSHTNVNLICEDVSFVNNSAVDAYMDGGGAIYANNDVTINGSNVSFVNNIVKKHGNGGAIYANNDVTVNGFIVSFVNNSAISGGAIYTENGDVTVNGFIVSFVNNTATNYGGAILANSINRTVSVNGTDVSFINNLATDYGGAIYTFRDSVTVNALNSVSFVNNTATQTHGGAIFVAIGNVTVNGNKVRFVSNTATRDGGAIYADGNVTVNGFDVSFINNTAGFGGVIYAESGNASITNGFFEGNNGNNIIYAKGGRIINSIFIGNHIITGISTVYQNCILTVLVNNQSSAFVNINEDFNLTAKLVDNQNNTYYSTGLTYQIYKQNTLIKNVTSVDELFNAISNITDNKYFYTVTASYIDSYNKITSYTVVNASLVPNDSFTALDTLINNTGENGVLNLTQDYIMYSDEVSTYTNGIFINKAITINANGYTIDANKTGRIFTLGTDVVLTLKNITLKNGNTTSNGGAIYSRGNVTLINSAFKGNTARYGGAIYNERGANFTIINSIFTNNTSSTGGAIYNNGGANFTIVNSTFTNNTATDLIGAIGNYGGAGFIIINSIFTDNTAKNVGVIYNNGGADLTIINSTFTNNTVTEEAGVIYNHNDSASFTIINSTFTNNIANGNCSVIENYGGANFTIINSTFVNNTAPHYGAICNEKGIGFTISNSTFSNTDEIIYNSGELFIEDITADGSAYINNTGTITSSVVINVLDNESEIYVISGTPMILEANVTASAIPVIGEFRFIINNKNITATYDEEFKMFRAEYTPDFVGIETVNAILTGAKNSTVLTASILATTGNSFYDLNATIEFAEDNIVNLNKSYAFDSRTDSAFVNGIIIDNNLTINGNGYIIDGSNLARIFNVTSTGNLTLINGKFTNGNNTVGGVIYSEGTVSVVNSTFNNNNAEYGGVIYNTGNGFSVVNSIFTNNTASIESIIANSNGCVIYNKGGANFSVVNSTFADNSVEGGAVIYNTGINCTVVNSTFSGNNARNRGGVIYNIGTNFTIVNSTFIGNHDMIGISTVYQNCVLTILANNQSITSVKPNEDFNLTAKLVDNQGNTYYSTGLTYQIYNETGLIKEITANNLFNAITNLTNSGSYNISANYTDPGHTITNYVILNATVYIYSNNVILIGKDLIKYYKGDENYDIYLKLSDGTPLAGETVAVTINGKTYDLVTDNNGFISLPIGLNAGNYTIFSIYDGGYGFTRLENNITILSTIVGSDTTVYYRNGSSYITHVVDSQGRIVVGQTIRMNINGVFYDCVTDFDGSAFLPIGLNAGTYVITAENPINGEKTSNNVTVLATVTGEDISIYHRNGSGYSVKVLDGQGNPAKGVNVKMNVNGVFYDVVTDDEGIATLLIGLSPGDYIVTAEYNGFKTSNKITVLPVLTGDNIRLYYRDGTSYKVKLVDGQGNPLAGTNVTMNINGVFYYRTTGIDGVADLPIGLLPGTYIITTTYQDHVTSNTVTVLPRD